MEDEASTQAMDAATQNTTSLNTQFTYLDLERLKSPYPPKALYVADNDQIRKKWANHLATNPVVDRRINKGKRMDVHLRSPDKQAYIIKEKEDLVLRDRVTGKIRAQFIHNVIQDSEVLDVVKGVITDHLNRTKKTLRDNDPGIITSVGYTSGSHSARNLNWAQNIRDSEDIDLDEHAYKLSCVYAHVWAMIEPLLHPDILADFEDAKTSLGGLAMDAGARNSDGVLKYAIKINGEKQRFETKTVAPAAGVCGINYGSGIHNETNFNKFVISFNISRSQDWNSGGNFDIASYGLLALMYSNMVVAWRAEDYHGTSLLDVDPLEKEPQVHQVGLSFLLPKSLRTELERERANGRPPQIKDVNRSEPMLLDDTEVKPKPRATMPEVVPKKSREEGKLFAKDFKEVFEFPKSHTYSEWSAKDLKDECARRTKFNAEFHYAISWTKDRFVAALLKDDDVEFTSIRILRKGLADQNKKIDREDNSVEDPTNAMLSIDDPGSEDIKMKE